MFRLILYQLMPPPLRGVRTSVDTPTKFHETAADQALKARHTDMHQGFGRWDQTLISR